ncbi:MAG: NifB/NifX family molybdenum-iron cluster-binding protein [Acidobacteriota bacterium]
MKIAAVTDDGKTIHSHFGQALYYEVLTIENNAVVARERRPKPAHQHSGQHEHHPSGGDTHALGLAKVIADCQGLLARGMGQPAFQALQAAGIQPVLTEKQTIDDAVQAYLRGDLAHRAERVHQH